MIVPKKCENLDCNLYHTNKDAASRKIQNKVTIALIEHISTQAKIIANLTNNVQVSGNQIVALTNDIRNIATVLSEID